MDHSDDEDDCALGSDVDGEAEEEDSDLTSEDGDEDEEAVEETLLTVVDVKTNKAVVTEEEDEAEEQEEEEEVKPRKSQARQAVKAVKVVTDELFQQYMQVLHKPAAEVTLQNRATQGQQAHCVMATIGELIRTRGFVAHVTPKLPAVKGVNIITASPQRNSQGKWFALFYVNSKLAVQTARDIAQCWTTHCAKLSDVVVVCTEGLTSVARHSLNVIENLQMFDHTELVVNYTKHKLVPQQEALSAEEVKALLGAYRLKSSQLPSMSKQDPIAKFHGWAPGTIVKCTKYLGQAREKYVSYRVVS